VEALVEIADKAADNLGILGVMTRRFGLAALAGLCLVFPAAALDFDSEVSGEDYGSITDYLDDLFGIDENAGLTSFPILNVPMGGRAEGMATAFSAVADDASFIEWNPAASALLDHSEAAFFHNNWIADTKVEGAVFSNRSGSLGTAFGAKCLYVPFSEYNWFGTRVSNGYYAEGLGILNAAYSFFSSYNFPGVALGVSLKGGFRYVPDYTNAANESTETETPVISGSGASQQALNIMADLGMLTRFNFLKTYPSRDKNASLAVVLRNIGVSDGFNWWSDEWEAVGDALPTAAVAAASWRPLRPVLLSFDLSFPVNLYNLDWSEKPYWAAGFQVAVTGFLSLRGGFLAKSGNTRATMGCTVAMNTITFDANYTLDLLTQFRSLNRVSVGVRVNLGDGGRSARAKKIDALYLDGLDSYAAGNDTAARSLWEELLDIEKDHKGARAGLDAIEGYSQVADRIRFIQEQEQEMFR